MGGAGGGGGGGECSGDGNGGGSGCGDCGGRVAAVAALPWWSVLHGLKCIIPSYHNVYLQGGTIMS